MTNLLPHHAQKELKREYLVRLISVLLIFIAIMTFIGAVFLLPSFFSVQSQKNVVDQRIAELDDLESTELQEETRDIVSSTREKIEVLSNEQRSSAAVFLQDLVDSPSLSVSIESFFHSRTEEGGVVRLRGNAPTRDILVAFSEQMRSDPRVADVTLPISNLAASRDIEYSMDIQLKQ